MNDDYVAEMLRATGTLRSGDPAGLTAIIQSALAAAGLVRPADAGPPATRAPVSDCLIPTAQPPDPCRSLPES